MPNAIADNRVFQYFNSVDSASASAGDYQRATSESVKQANLNIWNMFLSEGTTLPALLLTISMSATDQLKLKQNWMSHVIDFTKNNQPNITTVKGMFESQNEEIVGWKDGALDASISSALELVTIFGTGAQSDVNPNLTIDNMFDATGLASVRAAYQDAAGAINKLKTGQKLNFDDKKKLASMFEKLNTSMSSLKLAFAPGYDQSAGSYDISSDSLQAKLSSLTNQVSSLRQKFDPMITNIFNPASIMHS